MAAAPQPQVQQPETRQPAEGAAKVAVAADFAPCARALAAAFAKTTGEAVTVDAAPTAELRSRILKGAPYDVLLSADAQTPGVFQAGQHEGERADDLNLSKVGDEMCTGPALERLRRVVGRRETLPLPLREPAFRAAQALSEVRFEDPVLTRCHGQMVALLFRMLARLVRLVRDVRGSKVTEALVDCRSQRCQCCRQI